MFLVASREDLVFAVPGGLGQLVPAQDFYRVYSIAYSVEDFYHIAEHSFAQFLYYLVLAPVHAAADYRNVVAGLVGFCLRG